MPHGKGTYTFPGGYSYDGDWSPNKLRDMNVKWADFLFCLVTPLMIVMLKKREDIAGNILAPIVFFSAMMLRKL